MHVVPFRRQACKDTLATLTHLMHLAKQGKVAGLAVCAKDTSGRDSVAFTGSFSSDPNLGLAATVRMSIRLTALLDERDAQESAFS
jgi:hypothetical protein